MSTPLAAPLVTGTRLRGGTANCTRGAASFLREQIGTAREAGATGQLIARMDSSSCNGPVISACRAGGAHFPVTMRMDPKVRRHIATIAEDAWTPVKYPTAVRRREGMGL